VLHLALVDPAGNSSISSKNSEMELNGATFETGELVAVPLEIYLHKREFFIGASKCVLPQEIDGLAELAPKNIHFFKALGDAVKDLLHELIFQVGCRASRRSLNAAIT
jgi:hypothetical protein